MAETMVAPLVDNIIMNMGYLNVTCVSSLDKYLTAFLTVNRITAYSPGEMALNHVFLHI